jgi:hypothetical protein
MSTRPRLLLTCGIITAFLVGAPVLTHSAASASLPADGGSSTPNQTAPPPRASDRYVNCSSGNDRQPGTAAAPLRTVAAATASPLPPGSTVRLARGCSWDGPVALRGTGTAAKPITLSAYGSGAAPTLTGRSVGRDRDLVQLLGAYQAVADVRVSAAAGTAIALRADNDAVRDTEIDNAGIGIRFSARNGSATAVNVHDLHMVVNTPGGDDDYGAIGFDVEAAHAEISGSRCTNCRAPSHDYGYDGGFVEIWNHGDGLYVHDNAGDNTDGILEIGGNAGRNGSAQKIALRRNDFRSAHGGIIVHTRDRFAIPVSSLDFSENTVTNDAGSDPAILSGDIKGVTFNGNTVTTRARVSGSGAPASHRCNAYAVSGSASIGYAIDGTEWVDSGKGTAVAPRMATCAGGKPGATR